MTLPTHEEISIGITKQFVNKYDINRFSSYIKSIDERITPIEGKAKECDMRHVIEEGHVIETAIEHMNTEIIRMIHWTKEDLKRDTEKLAKDFIDVKIRYNTARDILQYGCTCTRKK
jgi:hypothetical protein